MKLDKEAQIWKTVLLPLIRADWVCKPTPAVVTYQFSPFLMKSGVTDERNRTVV
jgi:hypothetical protein